MKFKVLDLFSGIGGFSLGLERTGGFETVAFCEIEEFPRKVLNKHWPDVPIYEDVRNVTAERLRADGIIPDIITGGFPCQDISVAGNQAGIGEGTRSGLWSECARLLGDIRPRYAIFENVTALLSGDNGRWFEQVLWDISQVGYDAEWHCISASELGAHHHRDRVWIIAYPSEIGCGHGGDNRKERHLQNDEERRIEEIQQEWDKRQLGSSETRSILADSNEPRLQRRLHNEISYQKGWEIESNGHVAECSFGRERHRDCIWSTEPELGRVANGIPDRAHRLKGLGNAVVPQIPEMIGRAILEYENKKANLLQ